MLDVIIVPPVDIQVHDLPGPHPVDLRQAQPGYQSPTDHQQVRQFAVDYSYRDTYTYGGTHSVGARILF